MNDTNTLEHEPTLEQIIAHNEEKADSQIDWALSHIPVQETENCEEE